MKTMQFLSFQTRVCLHQDLLPGSPLATRPINACNTASILPTWEIAALSRRRGFATEYSQHGPLELGDYIREEFRRH